MTSTLIDRLNIPGSVMSPPIWSNWSLSVVWYLENCVNYAQFPNNVECGNSVYLLLGNEISALRPCHWLADWGLGCQTIRSNCLCTRESGEGWGGLQPRIQGGPRGPGPPPDPRFWGPKIEHFAALFNFSIIFLASLRSAYYFFNMLLFHSSNWKIFLPRFARHVISHLQVLVSHILGY